MLLAHIKKENHDQTLPRTAEFQDAIDAAAVLSIEHEIKNEIEMKLVTNLDQKTLSNAVTCGDKAGSGIPDAALDAFIDEILKSQPDFVSCL